MRQRALLCAWAAAALVSTTRGACIDKCSPSGGHSSHLCTIQYCDQYRLGGGYRARCASSHAHHNYAVAECQRTCGICVPEPISAWNPVYLRVGAQQLAWSGGLNTASASDTSQQWRLTKCSGAACGSNGGLGNNALWAKTTGALVTCDVITLRNVQSGKVKDCAHGGCSDQPWPPPGGHWGTPGKVMKAGSVACGVAIKSSDSIWFAGMKGGKWPSSPISWVVRADNVVGSTSAATNFVVNNAAGTSARTHAQHFCVRLG